MIEFIDRYEASKVTSDIKKKLAWEHIAPMTPLQAMHHWPYLPNPLKVKGRPKGGPVATNDALFARMDSLVDEGKKPTTAARIVLKEQGVKLHSLKGRADYLVRLWKKRAK